MLTRARSHAFTEGFGFLNVGVRLVIVLFRGGLSAFRALKKEEEVTARRKGISSCSLTRLYAAPLEGRLRQQLSLARYTKADWRLTPEPKQASKQAHPRGRCALGK